MRAQEALSMLYGVGSDTDGARHRAVADVRELARLLPHLQARPPRARPRRTIGCASEGVLQCQRRHAQRLLETCVLRPRILRQLAT